MWGDIIKCLPDTKNYQKKLKSIELRKYPIKSECSFQCREKVQGRVVRSWVKITKVSARFDFRFEPLKSISVLILFVYKLMIGSSYKITEKIIQENAFEHKKRKPGLNLMPS